MRRLNFLFLVLFFYGCNVEKNQGDKAATQSELKLNIKGSDTVLPICQRMAETFMKEHPGNVINVNGGGSIMGIAQLEKGEANIAMSSRSMKLAEKLFFQEEHKPVKELIIGTDAIAIIVNISNPIQKLSKEELEKIYTGEVKNWKELGGTNEPILAYKRDENSGTSEFFKETVLNKEAYGKNVEQAQNTNTVISAVQNAKGGIGFIGLGYLNETIKKIDVSFDKGKTYVGPANPKSTKENLNYPLLRPLYFYYLESQHEEIAPFLDFVLSEKGQQLVLDAGYIPLR